MTVSRVKLRSECQRSASLLKIIVFAKERAIGIKIAWKTMGRGIMYKVSEGYRPSHTVTLGERYRKYRDDRQIKACRRVFHLAARKTVYHGARKGHLKIVTH